MQLPLLSHTGSSCGRTKPIQFLPKEHSVLPPDPRQPAFPLRDSSLPIPGHDEDQPQAVNRYLKRAPDEQLDLLPLPLLYLSVTYLSFRRSKRHATAAEQAYCPPADAIAAIPHRHRHRHRHRHSPAASGRPRWQSERDPEQGGQVCERASGRSVFFRERERERERE